MEFSFIKIENSFNKKVSDKENLFSATSLTTQKDQEFVFMSSQTMSSMTVPEQIENRNFINFSEKNTLIREIIVGTIGTVLGAIISYFIIGIK